MLVVTSIIVDFVTFLAYLSTTTKQLWIQIITIVTIIFLNIIEDLLYIFGGSLLCDLNGELI